MRIRSTKPEFWRSERIATVDWEARLVLKGLESYVDDNGVGKDDLALIVGDLFSRDLIREPSRTLARVSEAISALHQAGLVHRYEHEGTHLLYLSFWESVQRIDKPASGRFPRPDGTLHYKASLIRECLASPREGSRGLAPGTGEQGNRGTEISSPSATADEGPSDAPDPFDEFWAHYPRKVDKGAARKAWRSALKQASADEIITAVKAYPFSSDPQYVKYPASWLNKGSWADAPDNVRPIRGSRPAGATLTDEQIADVLGPDYEPIAPPADLDPEQDWRAYQDWMRQARTARRAQREEQALHRLGGAG